MCVVSITAVSLRCVVSETAPVDQYIDWSKAGVLYKNHASIGVSISWAELSIRWPV